MMNGMYMNDMAWRFGAHWLTMLLGAVVTLLARQRAQAVGVERGVPLERDLDLHRPRVAVLGLAEIANVLEQDFARRVDVTHKVANATLVLVADRLIVGSFVVERDAQASVQKGHHLESFDQGLCSEVSFIKDGAIGPEANSRDRCTLR